jgi:hypothetical protein
MDQDVTCNILWLGHSQLTIHCNTSLMLCSGVLCSGPDHGPGWHLQGSHGAVRRGRHAAPLRSTQHSAGNWRLRPRILQRNISTHMHRWGAGPVCMTSARCTTQQLSGKGYAQQLLALARVHQGQPSPETEWFVAIATAAPVSSLLRPYQDSSMLQAVSLVLLTATPWQR